MKDDVLTPSRLSRPSAPLLDAILGRQFKVLNHGFLRVIDYMGNDAAIVQAARVSYGAGTKTLRDDARLIHYLLKHRHSSPFEMCSIKLHVKMPIFVARQWVRHRTASINEYSARYSVMSDEFYVPDGETLNKGKMKKIPSDQQTLFDQQDLQVTDTAQQSRENGQGRDGVLSHDEIREAINKMQDLHSRAYRTYQRLLGKGDDALKRGVARELARLVLPVSNYTEWYWTIDLHNLLHFLALRCDSHAQHEIKVYADKIKDEFLPRWLPHVSEAFEEYRLNAFHLQHKAVAVVKAWVRGEHITQEESGLSTREWKELCLAFGKQVTE